MTDLKKALLIIEYDPAEANGSMSPSQNFNSHDLCYFVKQFKGVESAKLTEYDYVVTRAVQETLDKLEYLKSDLKKLLEPEEPNHE